MLSFRFTCATAALLAGFALGAPGSANGQLVLPKPPAAGEKASQPASKGGDLAPHLDCTVCGQRTYTAVNDGRLDQNGHQPAWCTSCRRETPHRPPDIAQPKDKSNKKEPRLQLPAAAAPVHGAPAPAPAPVREPPEPRVALAAAHPAASTGASPSTAALDVFDALRASREAPDVAVQQAVIGLLALGPDGLQAARSEIASQQPLVLLASARVLLNGTEEDRALVQERLRGRLPPAAGGPLVDALVEADPVTMSPRFLCELLDHAHAGVRAAAERHLRRHLDANLLDLLRPALASKRAQTRQQALGILADIDDPRVSERLLEHLADPSARVAATVTAELSARDDDALDARLLGVAFRERWILRESSYALIAIVEREDVRLLPLLDESHAESLLSGMQSRDPFVAGACATALAGIGFRSPVPRRTGWLESDVVDRLVATVSGKEFHNDISALERPALRRLRLVTGQEFPADGPRWVKWWLGARSGFIANRAHIEIRPQDAGRTSLRFLASAEDGGHFTLLGAELPAPADATSESVWITALEERDLLAVLAREGVLGPDRLPGRRGGSGRGERRIDIAVAGHGKSFVCGADADEAWFERIVGVARALRDRNRWQRYPRPGKHASQQALWRDEAAWWSAEHSDRERALRLKQMVFESLPTRALSERDMGVAELQRLYADAQVAEPVDFPQLSTLLRQEAVHAERAHALVQLAIQAARSSSNDPAQIPDTLAGELVNTLHDRFRADAMADMALVAGGASNAFARILAADPRPLLRAVAAETLARAAQGRKLEAQDVVVLQRLLGDDDPQVEIAAIRALGEQKVEPARTELLVRARLAPPDVRCAALRAVGNIGGELVLDALVLALSEDDQAIRAAAADGLSALCDPASVRLLVDMLGEGPDAPVFAPARAGLRRLGSRAWPELLRIVHSPSHPARRPAALLLAEQGQSDAFSPLVTILTLAPRDTRVASELAILSCVDLRNEADPASAWWEWWDGVVHDDAFAWFLAALVRAGLAPPDRSELDGEGTLGGRKFLLEVCGRSESFLAERARRELARMCGRELDELPPLGARRAVWIDSMGAVIEAPRQQ